MNKAILPKIFSSKLSKDINKIEFVENGDLIIADASEDYEGICLSVEVKNLDCHKLVSGLHTFLLRDKNKIFVNGFRGYILYNTNVHKECCKVSTGISVYGITQENLKKITIPIPPLDEQKRIAEILSLCDANIENLINLIDKKELYKKCIMQKLLSGEKRFNGFNEEWQMYSFNDIFIRIPSKKYQINQNEYLENGKYPIIDQGKQYVVGYSNNINKVLKNDSIIVFGDHTRKFKFIDFDFIVGADGVQLLRTKNEFIIKFMYYNLSNQYIPKTGYNRHFKYILDILFFLPQSIKEQLKIAELLTLLDDEIDNLKKELELRKEQKKGLMQKLLTGEIRV